MKRHRETRQMGISSIQLPEQNVPPGDSSIKVGKNTAPAVCEFWNPERV